MTKAPKGALGGAERVAGLHAFAVFPGAGVDFDFVALSDKNWHTNFEARGDFCRLEHFAGGVAFDSGLSPCDLTHHVGG